MSDLSVTCREVLTFLWAYLSGELEPEKKKDFDGHLKVCPSCVAYLDTYRTTVELSKGAFHDPACEPGIEEMPEDLVKAVMAVRRGE
jgi:anti-sigma factor RsiW